MWLWDAGCAEQVGIVHWTANAGRWKFTAVGVSRLEQQQLAPRCSADLRETIAIVVLGCRVSRRSMCGMALRGWAHHTGAESG